MFSSKTPNTITVNRDELIAIRTAQALENDGTISSAQGKDATLAAWHELGEKAKPAKMLSTRAKNLIAEVKNTGKSIAQPANWHPLWLTGALSLLAFVAGAFLEIMGDSTKHINLLSPPLLGLLVWNLAVYIFLIVHTVIKPFKSKTKKHQPLLGRHIFSLALEKLRLKPLRAKQGYIELNELLTHDYQKVVALWAARAFHLAALCFAVGIVLGMLSRGVGQEFVVGWESTWFMDKPEVVKTIFDYTYGLIPFPQFDTSLQAVQSMHFNHESFSSPDSAYWIIRLLMILVIVVILPRLILVGWNTLRLHRALSHFSIDTTSDYFKTIFKTRPSEGQVLIITPEQTKDAWAPIVQVIKDSLDHNLLTQSFNVFIDEAQELKDQWMSKAPLRVIVCWSALTPEPNSHGVAMKALSELPHPLGYKPILVLDTTKLAAERHDTRMKAWSKYAQEYDWELVTLDHALDNKDEILKFFKALIH